MKYFTLLIVIINTAICNSQDFYGIIEYKEVAKYARFGVFDATLEFNNDESYYFISPLNSKLNGTGDSSGFTARVNLSSRNTTKDFFYKESRDSVIKTHDDFLETSIYFNDYAKQEWKLIDSTKTIMGLACNKATTEFRGRKYEAWYTHEIPVNYGPRNFHGLPGLILEIEESTGILKILATKIKTEKTEKTEKLYPSSLDDNELISRSKYRLLKKTIRLEKNKILSSKLPKDQKIDLNCQDCIVELELF